MPTDFEISFFAEVADITPVIYAGEYDPDNGQTDVKGKHGDKNICDEHNKKPFQIATKQRNKYTEKEGGP